jgi:sensor histidine kinase YesM
MNPHFLFNTLNTISRTAMFEDASETTDLIRSLARVFRYMLQEPHATVTLKEELQIVEEYVKLQRHRFHERLSFVLHCEVDPVAVRIPALTLQPLVENAIRHGIEPKEEGGTVTVTCRMAADRMSIAVADDGVGMEHPTSEPTGDHIGLNNVHTRLQLLHGDELEFSFLSEVGVGTTVTIAFPAERREG